MSKYQTPENTPIEWVTVEPSNGAFHQLTNHAVLHKAECHHLKRAKASNVFEAFDGPRTAEWVWLNGDGFERSCDTCCVEFKAWSNPTWN